MSMRIVVAALVLVVGAGFLWQLTRESDNPERANTEQQGAVNVAPVERENAPAEKPTKKPPVPTEKHHVVGTVTGDAPLEGVRVEMHWEGAHAEGETDAEGRYSFAVPQPAKTIPTRLLAYAPDGRVGSQVGSILGVGEESKQPPIALKPGANVVLRTVDASGAVVPNAKLRVSELIVFTRIGPRKYPREVMDARTDAEGRFAVRLAIAEYRVSAIAPGLGRALKDFHVVDGTQDVVFELSPERQLKVIVRAKKTDRPVEGATVFTSQRFVPYGSEPSETDAHGEAHITGLNPADEVQLMAVPPGQGRPPRGPGLVRPTKVPLGAAEVNITIELPRTITFLVNDGDVPVPIDGTRIEIKPSAGAFMQNPPSEGVMENGRLVVRDCPAGPFHAVAHGPQGTAARLFCKNESTEGRPFQFKRACNIDFVVRRPDGSPAQGIKIGLFNQGNNSMGTVVTNAEGKARLESLFGQLAEIKILDGFARSLVGTVDLRKGDLRVEHTLPEPRRVEFLVKLNGKPGLPVAARVSMPALSSTDVVRDPEAGTFVSTYTGRAGDQVTASVSAPGFLTSIAKLTIPAGDETLRHTFDLQLALDLRVRESGSTPDGLDMELQFERDGSWSTVDTKRMFPRKMRKPTEDGWIFVGLDPGRYRMRAEGHQLVLGEAELRAGAANTLVLDYSSIVPIAGRVELPEGYKLRDVRVLWEGTVEVNSMFGVRPGVRPHHKEGTFKLFAVARSGARLTVRHPMLTPDLKAGAIVVDGARDDVVLKLVEGATLRFRIPAWFDRNPLVLMNPNYPRPAIPVRLFADDVTGKAVFSGTARATAKEWTLGGMRPGIYTLFVDVPNSKPIVRRNFEVKSGANDLGELAMEAGATIVVRILVNEPFVAPRLSAFAIRQGAPALTRQGRGSVENEVKITGLIPGTYKVMARPIMSFGAGGGAAISETIEIGTEDIELTLDLR